MPVCKPQGHEPHHEAREHHQDPNMQVEQRIDRLENDVHTLTRLIFSARHADQQDQVLKTAPTQQQWTWTTGPSQSEQAPRAKTTWSQDQPIKFASAEKGEQKSGGRGGTAPAGSKRPSKMRRYLLAVAMPVLCFFTIWLFFGGEASYGSFYRAVERLREMYGEKWVEA